MIGILLATQANVHSGSAVKNIPRRSREGRSPGKSMTWIPAFAGMTS
jgi:hypothetical protein